MPNNSYSPFRSTGFLFFVKICIFFLYQLQNFAKNANSAYVGTGNPYDIRIVWRQSGFAFLVRWLRLTHFLFFEEAGMTVDMAERRYISEVDAYCEQFIKKTKKGRKVGNIIFSVLLVSGIVMTIVGFVLPPERLYYGEVISTAAIFLRIYGIIALCVSALFLPVLNVLFHKDLKRGPRNFLVQKKNLYFNYLKCEDMSDSDKEFYKQKLEDIRNMELVGAIHRSSDSVSAAILFATLKK